MSTAIAAESIAALRDGAQHLGLALSSAALGQLDAHLDLVVKWNAVHNLTAIRNKAKMITHHVLDSLAVAPHIPTGARLLDAGSGAGFPGISLAIARPDIAVTVIDSNQKKGAFLQQAVTTLRLPNVTVTTQRVEEFNAPDPLDIVISRAFSDLADFAALTRHLLAPAGRLFAMKGVLPEDELRRLPSGIHLDAAVALDVPGLDAERHLLILSLS